MLRASLYLNLPEDSPLLQKPGFRRQEYAFFRDMTMSNGTVKATHGNRLDDVNRQFFDIIARTGLKPSRVVDIGVSSGITTAEWIAEFAKHGMSVHMTATDLVMRVHLIRLNRFVSVLVQPNGHVLQFEILGRGVRAKTKRRDYVTLLWLPRRLLSAWANRRLRSNADYAAITSGKPASDAVTTLSFAVPSLRANANADLLEHDILTGGPPLPDGTADVVRVANLLQHIYFTPPQMSQIVENIRRMCHPESIVVICRNKDDELNASFLRCLADGSFRIEGRIGNGSEAESYFIPEQSPDEPSGRTTAGAEQFA